MTGCPLLEVIDYFGYICGSSAEQLGTKYHLIVLVARALEPTGSAINVSCCEPTLTELLCSIHHSSDDTISLFYYPVSLQRVSFNW